MHIFNFFCRFYFYIVYVNMYYVPMYDMDMTHDFMTWTVVVISKRVRDSGGNKVISNKLAAAGIILVTSCLRIRITPSTSNMPDL